MAKQYLPLFRPGDTVTFNVTDDVTAGQLVQVGSVDRSVAPAAAGSSSVVGVAGHDAAVGDLVTIEVGKTIHLLTASGAIVRGARVATAAAGAVASSAEGSFGVALTSAAAGEPVEVIQL